MRDKREVKTSSEQAAIIADAIERSLDAFLRGDLNNVSFLSDVEERDPTLYDPKNLRSSSLVAVWNFADTFSDAATHGFPDVDGISWSDAIEILQEAAKKLKEGQPLRDARLLTSVNAAIRHWNKASVLLKEGRYQAGIAECRAAIKLDPALVAAHTGLAIGLNRSGQWKAAMAEFEVAVWLAPEKPEMHYNLGAALLLHGQIKEAIPELWTAIKLNPDYAEAHHALGRALDQNKEIEPAIAHYWESIRLNPEMANAYMGLGNVLAQLGDHLSRKEYVAAALDKYQQARRLDPKLPGLNKAFMLIYLETGQYWLALKELLSLNSPQ